jgi:hypothetical protein
MQPKSDHKLKESQVKNNIREYRLHEVLEDIYLTEALTKADENRVSIIARKEANKLFKDDFMPKLQAEIEKEFSGKEHEAEVVEIVKRVLNRLYKDLAYAKSHVVDSIRL